MTDFVSRRASSHLRPAEASRWLLARPKAIAVVGVVGLAGLGWLYLALMIARSGDAGLLDALCRSSLGRASLTGQFAMLAVVFSMWCAMALAMMLPTAGPTVLAYANFSESAERQAERIASPLWLTMGYLAVWFGFAVVATALQALLTSAALLDPAMASANPLFSGAVLIGAGAYQFSALKQACLARCRSPLPRAVATASTDRRTIFRLGRTQGLLCLGCCWAMMLVMFAVGVMNIAWMAALGAVMLAEKLTTTMRFSRAVGVALLAVGAGITIAAVVAHWPARLA